MERELVEISAAIIDIETTTGLEWQSQFVATGMERADSKERYIAGLGAGDYVVTTTLNDRISGKTGAFSTPITIR